MRATRFAGLLVMCSAALSAAAADTASDRMLERLRTLAGEWEGTYEWSQGRTGSGQLKVRYYVTGNGSAVVEDLIMGGVPMMTTVYHVDGADLRMTHYCAAKNQPRLKASRIDEVAGSAQFAPVDVTNLTAANPGHVQRFSIQLLDADHMNLQFTFGGGPGSGVEDIKVTRVRAPATT